MPRTILFITLALQRLAPDGNIQLLDISMQDAPTRHMAGKMFGGAAACTGFRLIFPYEFLAFSSAHAILDAFGFDLPANLTLSQETHIVAGGVERKRKL